LEHEWVVYVLYVEFFADLVADLYAECGFFFSFGESVVVVFFFEVFGFGVCLFCELVCCVFGCGFPVLECFFLFLDVVLEVLEGFLGYLVFEVLLEFVVLGFVLGDDVLYLLHFVYCFGGGVFLCVGCCEGYFVGFGVCGDFVCCGGLVCEVWLVWLHCGFSSGWCW